MYQSGVRQKNADCCYTFEKKRILTFKQKKKMTTMGNMYIGYIYFSAKFIVFQKLNT